MKFHNEVVSNEIKFTEIKYIRIDLKDINVNIILKRNVKVRDILGFHKHFSNPTVPRFQEISPLSIKTFCALKFHLRHKIILIY